MKSVRPFEKRLKILHVVPAIEEEAGGPSTILRTLIPLLEGVGIESELVTTVPASEFRFKDASMYDPHLGVHVHVFARSHMAGWRYAFGLSTWINENIGRFDLIHIRSLYSYPALIASRVAAKSGVPRLLEPQGAVSRWSQSYKRYKKWPYLRMVERGQVLNAEGILVTHPVEERDMHQISFGRHGEVFCVPPPITCPIVPLDTEGKLAGAKLLFLSRLHEKKGLELLLRAYSEIDVRYCNGMCIAGSGERAYEARLNRLVIELGLENRISLLGHVSGDRREQAFNEGALLVLPSWDENFGLVVVEAVARGLPVIASDAVAAAEYLAENGFARIFNAGDANALKETIVQALSDFEWRKYVLENGPSFVRDNYAPEIYTKAIAGIYSTLALKR